MYQFQLKTHIPDKVYQGHYFFIQSKEYHSGKPLKEPYPNCFVCICHNQQEVDNMYWILYSLWQGRKSHEVLVGSVIPFIRKKDLQNLIEFGLQKQSQNPQQLQKKIETLNNLRRQELNYQKINEQIIQMKVIVVNQLFAG